LFNWLYARHCGGRFLLRIEDTDRERSTEANVQIILDGLSWLGVTWDEEPVLQFNRADRHRECVQEMLAAGRAYRCFMTPSEADAAKEVARAEGHALRSPWRDRTEWPNDAPFVVRFKAPMDGETVVEDLIRGAVSFPNKDLEDIVLLRSDGTPTYNVAVTVDDHDMGITHIIRGEEHLSNGARQTLLYRAMGWELPTFAHIPLIHGPDGAKLSKRHGAQAVGEFADMGYLPEGMRNYLARLGWGHGDDEVFSDAQAIEWFDVADVVKAPARLDWAKLNHINNQHLRKADDARLAALTREALERQGVTVLADLHDRLQRTVALVKEGCATTVELAAAAQFALAVRPFTFDDKTVKLLTDETRARLGRLRHALAGVTAWEQPVLEAALKSFAESEGVGLGKFGPALRGVLSGGHPAPDLASTLAALGPDEGLARIDDALCAAQ